LFFADFVGVSAAGKNQDPSLRSDDSFK